MLSRRDAAEIRGRYEGERQRFEALTAVVQQILTDALRTSGIKNMVTARAKMPDSLERKLLRDRDEHDKADFDDGLSPPMKDLAAARVLLYRPQDKAPAVQAIEDAFPGCDEYKKTFEAEGKADYQAVHLVARLDECEHPMAEQHPDGLNGLLCEIQITLITHHLWNELEHDIIYKQPDGKPDAAQDELLQSLWFELDLTTNTVRRLMDATDRRKLDNKVPVTTPEDLRRVLEDRTGSTLQGDFRSFFDLLDGMRDELVPRAIDELLGARPLEQAQQLAEQHDVDGAYHDVGVLAACMLPALGLRDVIDFVEAVEDTPPLWSYLWRMARHELGEAG